MVFYSNIHNMGRLKNFTREEVLEKSFHLFWRKGFADTSLKDLENVTGVNKSGLYSEFKDKDDLFLESLKHYRDSADIESLLYQSPMGIKNIETLLKLGLSSKGQKGCFIINTSRELSILPPKAKDIIINHIALVKKAVVDNLKAEKKHKTSSVETLESLADLVITFNTGVKMKVHYAPPELLEKEIDQFLQML